VNVSTSPTQDSTPDGRVVIPADVYVALEVIRRSGVTNMMDRPAVQFYADRRGFVSAVCWLEDSRQDYYRGFMRGFAPDRALTDDEQDAIDEEAQS
jgi:hypothetical protein